MMFRKVVSSFLTASANRLNRPSNFHCSRLYTTRSTKPPVGPSEDFPKHGHRNGEPGKRYVSVDADHLEALIRTVREYEESKGRIRLGEVVYISLLASCFIIFVYYMVTSSAENKKQREEWDRSWKESREEHRKNMAEIRLRAYKYLIQYCFDKECAKKFFEAEQTFLESTSKALEDE